ncbi:MAG: AI-2E family transporter, partial [Candidatus Hydrogenedentes bacterium]|nr:AI-2E family transporter [Candidatus Hydrogenedentota bacterium]
MTNETLKPVFTNPWVRAACVLVAIILAVLLAYLLRPVLIALFLAFLVAYVLNPIVDAFERKRLPRAVTIVGLGIVGVLLVLSVPFLFIPNLISEADTLGPAAIQDANVGAAPAQTGLIARVDHWLNRLPLEQIVERFGWRDEAHAGLSARAIVAEKISAFVKLHANEFLNRLAQWLPAVGQSAGTTVGQIAASVGRGTLNVLVFLGNLAIFAVVAGYLLKDFHHLIAGGKDLVPPRHRAATFRIVGEVDLQVRSFLRGQLLVCLCLGLIYAVGLLSLRVPFAIPIAVFGMFANLIPYVGLVTTLIIAGLMTVLRHELDWHLVGVVLLFGAAQAWMACC